LVKVNLESLKIRREELCLNFAKKCIKNEKTKDMSPLRVKDHQMEIREEEMFVIDPANTERLKKSSISYMQRLLNKMYKQRTLMKVSQRLEDLDSSAPVCCISFLLLFFLICTSEPLFVHYIVLTPSLGK
jgi:hypothetical protein